MLIFNPFKKGDRALLVLTVAILAGIGLLLLGLWYVQVVCSRRYLASQKVQSFRAVRVPALRGKILDRNGNALAENRPSFNVDLYLEELRDVFQEEFSRAVAQQSSILHRRLTRDERSELGKHTRYWVVSNVVQQLSQILQTPLSLAENDFLKHYTNSLVMPLPILDDLTPEQLARFQEQPDKPPGLNLEIQPLRVYTNGTLAAHMLGHLQRTVDFAPEEDLPFFYPLPDFEGKVGLEGAFDQELRGHAGYKYVLVNNMGYRQSENVWQPAEPGHNLILTIDLRIQKAAEQALHSNGADVKGAVVVMDPRNGDLLALASSPTYDPNQFVPRISSEEYQRLLDPDLHPLINRATYGAFAPGSIFKIVVALAGLESGIIHPDVVYHSKGYYQLGRKIFHDEAPAGDYNFRLAFLKSSNSYFIEFGLQTGWDRIMAIGQRFFLGHLARVPLLQERSGLFPNPNWLERRAVLGEPLQSGDVANLCIGQGYIAVTPLQMAVMTSAVANGGKVFWPRLVDRIESQGSPHGEVITAFSPGRLRGDLGVQPYHLKVIRDAMRADVEDSEGTGQRAAVPEMRICGKTGTAQVARPEGGFRRDAWFVSFAPYEQPRYVVVVFVEGGGYGGLTSAPIARQIYQAIQHLERQSSPSYGSLAAVRRKD
ncbi:MAG: penicillin-binding protein 2 [Candidatus Omnitrophica bacterium]|nr:penicillin-binding protein 2 [Candidatus Omnitrophota bacterium]